MLLCAFAQHGGNVPDAAYTRETVRGVLNSQFVGVTPVARSDFRPPTAGAHPHQQYTAFPKGDGGMVSGSIPSM
jgi:hypothetical protein